MNSTAIWGFVGSIARTGLAAFAGWLVKLGVIQESATDATVGALLIVGTLAWGVFNKYVLHKEIGNIPTAK